jgi:DNA repair exonuclease SbcCD ATPase subunit
MNGLVKEKIRSVKDEIKVLELKRESFQDKVDMQESFIEELENRGRDNISNNNRKISDLDKEIEQYLKENESVEEPLQELIREQDAIAGYADKLRKLGNLKGKISQKVSTITKEHKFFTENTVCPTCTQSIDEEFRINKIDDAQNKAKELQSGYKELEEAIKEEEKRECQFNSLSKEISNLTNGISQNNIKINGLRRQIKNLESEIQTLTENLANRNSEHEKLEEYKNNLNSVLSDLDSVKEKINYYDYIYSLLKDGGVKTKIIKKYLPLINQQVNRYLQMMDFYINFHLDEEFSESIRSPIHEDFSYTSFSEGEKMRIDLALLFTWREIAKIKNSLNCNIIIFDETFDSSLDGFGTDEFLKIIRYVIKDANVFVISHKEGMRDKFNNVIKFEKIKGFSRAV